MENKLSEALGFETKISKQKKQLNLPEFMTARNISIVETYGVSFAIIDISEEPELSAAAIRKQKVKYEEALHCPVVFNININSVTMRNALVKNGVPFIDSEKNMFMPFLGMVLLDVYRKKNIKIDKMMPATQLVFLKLLYMEDDEQISKTKLAQKLNLTKTSITRTTDQLSEMGLLDQTKKRTEISVKRNMSRREYYEKAKEHLINPVQKIVTVKKQDDLKDTFIAGESALSQLSKLDPPKIEERAIFKGSKSVEQFSYIDVESAVPDNCINVQLWKYDLSLVTADGYVDPVSLACTFKDCNDEKTQKCIDELLKRL